MWLASKVCFTKMLLGYMPIPYWEIRNGLHNCTEHIFNMNIERIRCTLQLQPILQLFGGYKAFLDKIILIVLITCLISTALNQEDT